MSDYRKAKKKGIFVVGLRKRKGKRSQRKGLRRIREIIKSNQKQTDIAR